MTQEDKYSQYLEMNRNLAMDFSSTEEEFEIKGNSSNKVREFSLA